MFGYRVPAPDEAMLISGRGGGPEGAPFRVVIGHGAFVTPVFRKVRYLTLSMQEAEVAETCVTERQKLATEVLDGSKAEMARIGLSVDSLQIQSIDDMGAGYIAAMAAPNNAAIQRQAKIAQAAADQAAAEAQQASQRKQAEFARETSVVQAQYKAEVDKAQAE